MPNLLRRPILIFALGVALTATLGAAGTAAYAALNDERVTACYAAKTGVLYVIGRDGAPAKCVSGDLPIDWSIRGPEGPPGVFTGTLTSPNGAYSISVTDAGIVLSAPGATARLAGSNITLDSSGSTTVQSGTTFAVASGTNLALAAGGNLTLQASKDLATSSGSATTVAVGKALSLGAGTDLSATVGGNLSATVGGGLSLTTAGATNLVGTGDVTVGSAHVATLKGTTGVVVQSNSGPVTLKGTKVTTN
jgi:uncharacterized protein (DUF2345 family)